MHRLRARALLAALSLGCAALLAGCGSAPEPSDPTGVDGLQIPTPSPQPDDFVEGVDNPWLALEPGTVWTYAVVDPTSSAPRELTMTMSVGERTRSVAGIDATVVEETLLDQTGETLAERERWLAEDADGNVWLLGRSSSGDDEDAWGSWWAGGGAWEAGVAGARAGLVMPAEPRVGDGFREGLADGAPDVRVRIVDLDAAVDVPAGDFTGALETEVTSVGEQTGTSTTWYAAGTGLLAEQVVAGGVRRIELVSVDSVP
ncbi:hypothetical protein [Nocardioides pacificus]